MNEGDYAIVVGIARYPALGEGGQPLDLKGPLNDVEAVVAWLTDPAGGNIPNRHPNLQVITSPPPGASAPGRMPSPSIVELEAALHELDRIAQENRAAMRGEEVGRRLYIYMSGHGFSPGRERACLYAANARERGGDNVHASGWLAWLQDAGYFREFVLWMDCCMNRMLFLQPRDPPLPPVNASVPPGPSFVAFAAQRPLKAVEAPIMEDGGRVHGLFTWALLEGLRGAAADRHGRVTGRSLADWIRNAQGARLSEADRNDPDVATEPEVVRESPDLVFARGVRRRSYAVSLAFPESVTEGAEARLWTGCPARIAAQVASTERRATLSLQPGLYVVEIPSAGLRQGFEVVGPGTVAVAERGEPVAEPETPDAMFPLTIDPQQAAAELFIVDDRLALVDRGAGSLSTALPFGVYKLKTRLGRGVREQVILLDRPFVAADGDSLVKPLVMAVPLASSLAIGDRHLAAAKAAAEKARAIVEGREAPSALSLVVRVAGVAHPVPWRGVSVADADGRTIIDLGSDRVADGDDGLIAFASQPVMPGTYFLRHGHAPRVEQSVVVPPGWTVSLHLVHEAAAEGGRVPPLPRLSVVMGKPAHVFDGFEQRELDEARRSIEAALVALADERRVLNATLERLLFANLFDPMAGIAGGHLLLVEAERSRRRDLAPLNTLVRELRSLVGPDHPDVEALSLACPDETLRRKAPLRAPPMLARSWALLTRASWRSKRLVPASVWARVQAAGALPPFLVWSPEDEVRAACTAELAARLGSAARSSAAARAAAQRLGLPAVALDVLPGPDASSGR